MLDYRLYDPGPAVRMLQVLQLLTQEVDAPGVNKARALEEVRADYSTTTEIADALLQKAEVPFRTGHHFASKLTDYGRGKGLKIHEIPYAEAARIYEEQAKAKLPLSEAEFREVISAEYMVFGRRGSGGPQLAEVRRMLQAARDAASANAPALAERATRLAKPHEELLQAFTALAA
jgi:argininosuccinate lyase